MPKKIDEFFLDELTDEELAFVSAALETERRSTEPHDSYPEIDNAPPP